MISYKAKIERAESTMALPFFLDNSNISKRLHAFLNLRYTKYIPSIWSSIKHRIIVSVWMNKENIWPQYQRQEYVFGYAKFLILNFREMEVAMCIKTWISIPFQPQYLVVDHVVSNFSYRSTLSINVQYSWLSNRKQCHYNVAVFWYTAPV